MDLPARRPMTVRLGVGLADAATAATVQVEYLFCNVLCVLFLSTTTPDLHVSGMYLVRRVLVLDVLDVLDVLELQRNLPITNFLQRSVPIIIFFFLTNS